MTSALPTIQVSVAPGYEALRSLLLQPWPSIEEASIPHPGGRGGVRDLPGGLVLRRCRRGGALGGLLGDRHLSPKTAWDEMRISERLMKEGVGVAEVVGVRAERRGFGWSLDVVTRRIEDAVPLRDLLPRAPAAGVARAVRRMHDSGLWHADLNLQNILVTGDGGIRIIDLSGSRVKRPLPMSARLDNIARLYRSLVKQHLPVAAFTLGRFLLTYFDGNRAAARKAIAACRAKLRRHRLWWALTGRAR